MQASIWNGAVHYDLLCDTQLRALRGMVGQWTYDGMVWFCMYKLASYQWYGLPIVQCSMIFCVIHSFVRFMSHSLSTDR